MVITRSSKRNGDILVELNFAPKKRKSGAPKKRRSNSCGVTETIVDRNLELTDPTPNIQDLYKSFDARYFAGLLSKSNVTVKWSRDLENAAGMCLSVIENDENLIIIMLNELLLMFRTRRDLVETLLHEMIHAHLSINNLCDDHGPNFQKEMNRINAETGANVTIWHDFNNEVALFENRLWRCNGKCRKQPPQFGLMRIDSKDFVDFENEWWWPYHLKKCGGKVELVRVRIPSE